MIFWVLLRLSLCVSVLALWRRSWWLMGIAAVLALPFALVANLAYLVALLLPAVHIAAAVALRWRGGAADWSILLLLAVLVWLVAGAGTIIIDGRLIWVQFAGLIIGLAGLLVGPTHWTKAIHRVAAQRK